MKIFHAVIVLEMSAGLLLAGPIQVGFEKEEGFEAGSGVLGQGWTVEDGSRIVTDPEEKTGGSQSLKIEAGENPGVVVFVSSGIPTEGVRFIDVRIRAAGAAKEVVETTLSAWGSSLGFVTEEEGLFFIAPVNGAQPVELVKTGVPSGADGGSADWIRLTVRQNLTKETWDLFVDGRLAAIDQAMDAEGRQELAVFGHEKAPIWLDELSVGEENPLFADGDRDGMPDAEEEAHGLNPYADDRNGDLDGDGISNIREMLAGTAPHIPGDGGMRPLASVVYVDNQNGSDANNGARSYAVSGDGPKASIKAAMAAAKDGDTIVIMPGKGTYDEGSRGAPGKRLTIKALSNVTIK